MKPKALVLFTIMNLLITGCTFNQISPSSSLQPTPQKARVTPRVQATPGPHETQEAKADRDRGKGETYNLEEELYWERLSNEELVQEIDRGSDMGISINNQVEAFLNYYSGPGKKVFLRYRQRAERYIPIVKKILEEEGIPEDLAYLPILESGYWASALSRSRALGYWQFIRSTARLYGLRIDPWVDERMDIEKSTRAAARYLKDLYRRLGSWELAIAAYNAGPIRIEQAMARAKSRNFWVLSRYLRKETREYVPRFMAILLLVHNPDLYGLPQVDPPPPLKYEKVKVKGMVNLKKLARLVGLNYRTLKKLNPALKKWVTPPGPPYELKVPPGYKTRVASILSNPRYAGSLYPVPDSHGNKWIRHRLARGESLYTLARFYGVPLSTLITVNGITNPRRIRAGKTILIPATPRRIWLARKSRKRTGARARRVKRVAGERVYKVREGDNLWSIARAFSVRVGDLKKRNGLRSNRIKPGDLLVIPPPIRVARKAPSGPGAPGRHHVNRKGIITYRVKKGDNLWKIARSFSVGVEDLKRWNGLKKNTLHPGKTLIIYASQGRKKAKKAQGSS